MPLDSELWKNVWDLYMRCKYVVDMMPVSKLVETPDTSYTSVADGGNVA